MYVLCTAVPLYSTTVPQYDATIIYLVIPLPSEIKTSPPSSIDRPVSGAPCKVTGRRHRVSPCRSAYFASPWRSLTLNLRRRRREAALLFAGVKALSIVRWATGKRLTNRLLKLSLITLSPPLNRGILGLRMGPYVPTPRFFYNLWGPRESDSSDS